MDLDTQGFAVDLAEADFRVAVVYQGTRDFVGYLVTRGIVVEEPQGTPGVADFQGSPGQAVIPGSVEFQDTLDSHLLLVTLDSQVKMELLPRVVIADIPGLVRQVRVPPVIQVSRGSVEIIRGHLGFRDTVEHRDFLDIARSAGFRGTVDDQATQDFPVQG